MSSPKTKTKTRRVSKPLKRTAPAAPAEPAAEGEEQPRRKKFHIQPQVLDLIRKNHGEPVTLKEITTILDCPESSVQHAVLKLRETVPQIVVVTKGQTWRWDPSAADLARPLSEHEAATPQPPIPAQRPAPAVEAEVPGPKYGERYVTVGRDQEGNRIVREEGDDPTLYVLNPL